MRFFVGLHQPSDAQHFDNAFISINRLKARKSEFQVRNWVMDSGAFTAITTHGGYPEPVEVYAEQVKRWANTGRLMAAVAQDYMCEPFAIAKTGLTITDHQQLTIERYDALHQRDCGYVYIMPVLQGYAPEDYADHVLQYRSRLAFGAWVGVGSVCKRNADPHAIAKVLMAILTERPDLKLHGFGLKGTALADSFVKSMLHSADSMAWSFAARREGRNPNDWHEAQRWSDVILNRPEQLALAYPHSADIRETA